MVHVGDNGDIANMLHKIVLLSKPVNMVPVLRKGKHRSLMIQAHRAGGEFQLPLLTPFVYLLGMQEEIYRLLTSRPKSPLSVKEVSRTLDRARSKDEPYWAKHLLRKLAEEGLIRETPEGYFVYDPHFEDGKQPRK